MEDQKFEDQNTEQNVQQEQPAPVSSPSKNPLEEIKSFSMMEKVLLGSWVLAVIAIFLPWLNTDAGFVSVSASGWQISWVVKILFLALLATAVTLFLARKKGILAAMGVGVAGIIYQIIMLFNTPGGGTDVQIPGMEMGSALGIGYYLYFLAGIVMVVSAFLVFKKK